MDVAKWCAEVIDLGDIVQDSEDSIWDEEREQRFNRYVGLVDAVAGDAPDEVFRCLLTSVRDQEDYGAHKAVLSAILRFGPQRRAPLAASELPNVIEQVPDFAGDLMGQLALDSDDVVGALNDSIAALPESQREVMLEFVACEEEGDGWLSSPSRKVESALPRPVVCSPASHPDGYCPIPATGLSCPLGSGSAPRADQ